MRWQPPTVAPNWQEQPPKPSKHRRKYTNNRCRGSRPDTVTPTEVCSLMRQWKRP